MTANKGLLKQFMFVKICPILGDAQPIYADLVGLKWTLF